MRTDKQLLLDEIFDHMENSKGFIMTRYKSLGAKDSGKLRADLEKVGAVLEIVKKRIFLKALEKKGLPFTEQLSGNICVVFAKEDVVNAAKVVVDFSDDKEAFELVGGQIDQQIIGSQEAKKLSKLPGKNELRAQFIGLLIAPMQQVVSIMNSHLAGFLQCLEQKIQQNK